jgi:hypothetical protein
VVVEAEPDHLTGVPEEPGQPRHVVGHQRVLVLGEGGGDLGDHLRPVDVHAAPHLRA